MATTKILETDTTNLRQEVAVAVSIHSREKLEELVSALLDSEASVIVLRDKQRMVTVEIVLRYNSICPVCGLGLWADRDGDLGCSGGHFFAGPDNAFTQPVCRGEPPTQKDKDTAIQPSFPRGHSVLFKKEGW